MMRKIWSPVAHQLVSVKIMNFNRNSAIIFFQLINFTVFICLFLLLLLLEYSNTTTQWKPAEWELFSTKLAKLSQASRSRSRWLDTARTIQSTRMSCCHRVPASGSFLTSQISRLKCRSRRHMSHRSTFITSTTSSSRANSRLELGSLSALSTDHSFWKSCISYWRFWRFRISTRCEANQSFFPFYFHIEVSFYLKCWFPIQVK